VDGSCVQEIILFVVFVGAAGIGVASMVESRRFEEYPACSATSFKAVAMKQSVNKSHAKERQEYTNRLVLKMERILLLSMPFQPCSE
jgi:hypothetical protein